MTAPDRRSALFVAVTATTVLAVLALGTLPSPTRVELAGASRARGADVPARRPFTTTTTEPAATIAPGVHRVGSSGLRAGVYVTAGDLCSWERRGPAGEVLAADTGSGQVLVEVLPTDATFSSAPGCGRWRAFDARARGAGPLPSFGSGTFAVGAQVAPGRWRSDGGDLCYWERLGGLTGGLEQIVASAGVPGPTEVEVAPGDAAFSSFGCGTWRPGA
jgi:hypothetical protein